MRNKKEVGKVKQLQSFGIIFNLVLAIFAFSILLNLESDFVKANGEAETKKDVTTVNNGETLNPESATNTDEQMKAARDLSRTQNPTNKVKPGKLASLLNLENNKTIGIANGIQWAGSAYFAIPFIGDALGLEDSTTNALQKGVSSGLFAWKGLEGFVGENGGLFGQKWLTPGVAGIATGAIVFILTYKTHKYRTVEFSCKAWEAPYGGDDCEKCNDGLHVCSEYRCKSLGKSCEFVEQGDDSICYDAYRGNVQSPSIRPWEDVLTDGYRYSAMSERPISRGTEIVSDDGGKIAAFTPITFGIQTNLPAHCKIGYSPDETFDEMAYSFGGSSVFSYNHSQTMNLPGAEALESFAESENGTLEIQNGGEYVFYVRCVSPNGYYNEDPYVISFSVEDGPDATPPQIVEFSIADGSPVNFGADEVEITAFTNEPSTCKWSRTNVNFEQMENEMTCARSIAEMQSNMLYACKGTLTNVEDMKDNVYYFRCEDQPWKAKVDRNQMQQSKEFTLVGTRPLNIVAGSVEPKEGDTVSGSTSTVPVFLKVETRFGYKEGDATCYFKTGDLDYTPFLETGTNKHEQRQDLRAGTYTYDIKCVDLGGNSNSTSTTFNVFVDTEAPEVTRVLYNVDALQISTSEDGECYYSTDVSTKCDFDMTEENLALLTRMSNPSSSEKTEHLASWDNTKTYYIKCLDDKGNMPYPTECSIVVKPSE